MVFKVADLEKFILEVLSTQESTRLQDIAIKARLSARQPSDRRMIQRALQKLIKQKQIGVHGQARSRHYSLALMAPSHRPLGTGSPKAIRYNPDFLMSYEPNQTYYLELNLQQELFNTGYIDKKIAPAGTYARTILNRLLIDLSWNSSRLEGNTYSLLETQRLIELGENAEGKTALEAQMILNHKEAIEYIMESVDETQITRHEICSIHALLSENLLGDPSASGRLRKISVGISGTSYLPLDNPHLLQEYFDLFTQKLNQIQNPFEQSFFALVHLAYLQAFEDVNKRTSRLVANISLIKQNLNPLSFIDVDTQEYVQALLAIYEKNDVSLLQGLYVFAYKRSAQQYSAIQQDMGEANLFKLKHRVSIHSIIQNLILEKIPGSQLTVTLKKSVLDLNLSIAEASQLLQIIETEIISLHEDNIARFKLRPSDFQAWKSFQ
jgi:Fic family protein